MDFGGNSTALDRSLWTNRASSNSDLETEFLLLVARNHGDLVPVYLSGETACRISALLRERESLRRSEAEMSDASSEQEEEADLLKRLQQAIILKDKMIWQRIAAIRSPLQRALGRKVATRESVDSTQETRAMMDFGKLFMDTFRTLVHTHQLPSGTAEHILCQFQRHMVFHARKAKWYIGANRESALRLIKKVGMEPEDEHVNDSFWEGETGKELAAQLTIQSIRALQVQPVYAADSETIVGMEFSVLFSHIEDPSHEPFTLRKEISLTSSGQKNMVNGIKTTLL